MAELEGFSQLMITPKDNRETQTYVRMTSNPRCQPGFVFWAPLRLACLPLVSLISSRALYPVHMLKASNAGFMQSVGTLQSYLQLNQLSHYSTGDIGWITGMYLFLSYFFNIQVGPICDHYGPMVVGPVGVSITIASFLILAECNTYWQMMLCLGLLGSLGGAIIATVAMSVVAKLFSRRQGLAMGVAVTGSSVGAVLFPMMLRSTLAQLGWKWAMRTLAFTIAGITVPGVFCFIPFQRLASSLPHHEPQRQGKAVINFAAFRSYAFTFVTGGSFLLEFAIFGIAGLLPTIAVDTGFSPEDGYTLLSVLGVGSCVGRVLPGIFGDLVGPFNTILVMTATTLLFMATLFIPFASKSESVLYAFSALWGFGSGSMLSVSPGEYPGPSMSPC